MSHRCNLFTTRNFFWAKNTKIFVEFGYIRLKSVAVVFKTNIDQLTDIDNWRKYKFINRFCQNESVLKQQIENWKSFRDIAQSPTGFKNKTVRLHKIGVQNWQKVFQKIKEESNLTSKLRTDVEIMSFFGRYFKALFRSEMGGWEQFNSIFEDVVNVLNRQE